MALEKQIAIDSTAKIQDSTEIVESLKFWPADGRIIFQNVFVKYREPLEFALKNLNVTINPSEKVILIENSIF